MSRAKVLITVRIFVRVNKVVIGLMFWNFVGMVLHMFPRYLELPVEEMQCSFLLCNVLFYCAMFYADVEIL
jgi:hypothetical protein